MKKIKGPGPNEGFEGAMTKEEAKKHLRRHSLKEDIVWQP